MSRWVIGLLALLLVVVPAPARPEDDSLPTDVLARLGEVRYRNVGRVFSLAFSPDGKTLLAGAWDGSLRLWDVAGRKEIRRYAGHRGWVRSVAFAPDGKTFASAGKDKIIRIWETATGKELRHFEAGPNWIQYLAYSPDGKVLASRATDPALRLWDPSSGRQVRSIALHRFAPSGRTPFAFSPDSKLLAYPGNVRSIVLFDLVSGKEVQQVWGQPYWYSTLSFSPDGSILAGMGSGSPQLWDAVSGKELRRLEEVKGTAWTLVFSPDRRSLATTNGDHAIHVWELATRQYRCQLQSPDDRPCVLAFSPDGRILAQASEDATVLLWDATGLQGRNRPQAASLSAKELQALWVELASAGAEEGHRAIRKLVAGSKDSVPFLRERLKPVAAVDARTLSRLVADLDSDQFEVREKATGELRKLAELAEPALRRARSEKPPLERRQRIDRLLERLAEQRDNPSPPRLRMLRALTTLEYADTAEARRVLEECASGTAAADLTNEAKAALERLAKRP